MLTITHSTRLLRFTRPGRLLPWLGPALRGLVARRFKGRVCRFTPEEQDTVRRYCAGCPHLHECSYGQTLEPEAPAHADIFKGQEDAARPLVFAPHFPLPRHVRPGDTLPLRVTFIGNAARQAPELWDAVWDAGGDPDTGLDPDHITFDLLEDDRLDRDDRRLMDLPLTPGALAGTVPRLKVELTAPLFLRTRGGDGPKRLVTQPGFADLFGAALRTLGQLAALHDGRLPADFVGLKEAAQTVGLVEAAYRDFRQPKLANRGEQWAVVKGITGSGVYAEVPLALVRWLYWAGQVHVGTHRVAGAGGWRLWWSEGSDDRWQLLD